VRLPGGLLRAVAAFALAAGFGGCALLPAPSDESGVAEPFELQGRVAVRTTQRSLSGSLRWQHEPRRDDVWLSNPLGQALAHIARDDSGAWLTTAEQKVHRARSFEALTREGLGWALPLADLSYYVLGKVPPALDPANVERGAEGRLARVRHGAWEVAFVEFRLDANVPHPSRLVLSDGAVEIRLVIDRLDAAGG